jgi:hypothetical protein
VFLFHCAAGKVTVNITTTASRVLNSTAQDSCLAVEEAVSSWAEVVYAREGKDVTLDELSSSLLRTLIPCIWCINDKKFEDPSFWKRAFLRRVTASEWEVLDELKDEVMDTLKWEGDNGLK